MPRVEISSNGDGGWTLRVNGHWALDCRSKAVALHLMQLIQTDPLLQHLITGGG